MLPRFDNNEERATAAYNEFLQGAVGKGFGDVSADAFEHGYDTFDALDSIRQTMLNLLAAGLYHALEQQLARACRLCQRRGEGPTQSALASVAVWILENEGIDPSLLPSFARVDELRLVANAVKHAEGNSAVKLRQLRPELFVEYQNAVKDAAGPLDAQWHPRLSVEEPLAGEDLHVSPGLLREYCMAATLFLGELADQLDACAQFWGRAPSPDA
ncbi:MAG TPA: hypothetical protein VMV31_14270 [Terriglobales bacterium]|nr:hypothetical protein [Terriglobales bacterium]